MSALDSADVFGTFGFLPGCVPGGAVSPRGASGIKAGTNFG